MTTYHQYAFFNERIYPNRTIPLAERWLFDEPFRVFPVGTLRQEVDRLFAGYQDEGVRYIGKSKTPSRVVLQAREVTFSRYQKVQTAAPKALR